MTLKRNPQVVHRRVGDEVVLVDLETNQVYALNETGGRAWDLLADHGERNALLAVLRGEFDVDERRLVEEIDSLIERLTANGLLVDEP